MRFSLLLFVVFLATTTIAAQVINQSTSMRLQAYDSAERSQRLSAGTDIFCISRANKYWIKVIHNGEVGYIKTNRIDNLQFLKPNAYEIDLVKRHINYLIAKQDNYDSSVTINGEPIGPQHIGFDATLTETTHAESQSNNSLESEKIPLFAIKGYFDENHPAYYMVEEEEELFTSLLEHAAKYNLDQKGKYSALLSKTVDGHRVFQFGEVTIDNFRPLRFLGFNADNYDELIEVRYENELLMKENHSCFGFVSTDGQNEESLILIDGEFMHLLMKGLKQQKNDEFNQIKRYVNYKL